MTISSEKPIVGQNLIAKERHFHKIVEQVLAHENEIQNKQLRLRRCSKAKSEHTIERNQFIDKLIEDNKFSAENDTEASTVRVLLSTKNTVTVSAALITAITPTQSEADYSQRS